MSVISSDELLTISPDEYQEIRRSATRARNERHAAFVCDHCGFPVYAPREPKTRLAFWRHHKGAPRSCPWWTGVPDSTEMVSASQFQGAQESALHSHLKNLVAELLVADPATLPGSVVVDQYVTCGEMRRRPDVRATYGGRPIAVEIQLATTQIPIIVAREDFYRREGRNLIWLTWNFIPVDRQKMITSFEDIFYSHNKNLFSIDNVVVNKSRECGKVLFRAFWEHGFGWNSRIVGLDELEWPETGLPFAVAPAPPWYVDFQNRWLSATTSLGTQWPLRRDLLNELADVMGNPQVDGAWLDEIDTAALLNAILSFLTGKPVGSAQKNLTEVINTFLSSERRFQFARLMRKVVSVTAGEEFLLRKSVSEKFREALKKDQDGPESVTGKIALKVFPNLFLTERR